MYTDRLSFAFSSSLSDTSHILGIATLERTMAEADGSNESNIFELIVTGLTLGAVHVLTGPDHLSALATLSATIPECRTSFLLGVRWGFGHSFGLLFVAVILLLRDLYRRKHNEETNEFVEVPDEVSHLFESLVGLFMLVLGIFSLRRALRKRFQYEGRIIPIGSYDEDEEFFDDENNLEYDQSKHMTQPQGNPRIRRPNGESYHDDPHESNSFDAAMEDNTQNHTLEISSAFEVERSHSDSDHFCSKVKKRPTLAVVAGIIHGLAGPGGVLGVIPAVRLHDAKLATIYLSCFCASSTIAMGCFASLYGYMSFSVGRKANLEFQIHCFSAATCILVGITWLVLLSMGKLEDVFP